MKDIKRIEETESLLIQCEKDLKKLKKLQKEIKKIEANRKKLNEYYNNQYIKDYDKYSNSQKNYRILNQDSIWNVLTDQYNEKIKILKNIIKSI